MFRRTQTQRTGHRRKKFSSPAGPAGRIGFCDLNVPQVLLNGQLDGDFLGEIGLETIILQREVKGSAVMNGVHAFREWREQQEIAVSYAGAGASGFAKDP